MKHKENRLINGEGASIYFQIWEPDETPRAVILIAHGLGEHGGRYEPFAEHFVASGYCVAALDHPGHGHSDGTPGFVSDFGVYVDTLERFRQLVSTAYLEVPIILLGHSMGGLVSTRALLEDQKCYAGCVLSGPAIMSDVQPGAFQMALIRIFSTVLPKLGVLQLDANGVSRDPEEVARYLADPLVFNGKISARLIAGLFQTMGEVQSRAKEIELPLLILHGGDDAMASPEGSRFLDANVGSPNKTLKIYPGLFHEIFNEPERPEVFRDVADWCDALLASGGGSSARAQS